VQPSDPKARFSDRVEDYVRHRPDYPAALLDWLRREHGVTPDWRVADIGAGTGISTKMFLDAGHAVVAVEPNAAMRAAATRWLGGDVRFSAVGGSAEATGLRTASVDLVSAAQAFHWFDPLSVRTEWARILRPGGLIAIYWNTRRLGGTPFLAGYERILLEHGMDYVSVAERYADDARMIAWFGAGFRGSASFAHAQRLGFDAIVGRTLSSSYAPRVDQPGNAAMLAALRALFDSTQSDDHVSMDYDTRIFVGTPLPS